MGYTPRETKKKENSGYGIEIVGQHEVTASEIDKVFLLKPVEDSEAILTIKAEDIGQELMGNELTVKMITEANFGARIDLHGIHIGEQRAEWDGVSDYKTIRFQQLDETLKISFFYTNNGLTAVLV